jgi:ATP-dependent Clp protease ATP-binding subunit ClpC
MATAEEEARNLEHAEIAPEHLLLGLVREAEGTAARVLHNFGDEKRVTALVRSVSKVPQRRSDERLALSAGAQKTLEYAVDEAHRRHDDYIGAEHLLLGLIRQSDKTIIEILADLDVSPDQLTRALETRLELEVKTRPGPLSSKRVRIITPLVDQLTEDLTEFARAGKLDPVIMREQELQRMIQVLTSRRKRNLLLVGPSGVGKTAVVHALAQRIADGNIPEVLLENRILLLDAIALIAGALYEGQFEERLQRALQELRAANDCIVFIDDMTDGIFRGRDRRGILLAFARANIPLIHTAATENFEQYLQSKSIVMDTFTTLFIKELSLEETVMALEVQRRIYESYHRITIDDDAIEAAARLSGLYIKGGAQPDKSIQVLDQAAAALSARLYTKASEQTSDSTKAGQERPVGAHLTAQEIRQTLSLITGLAADQLQSLSDTDSPQG